MCKANEVAHLDSEIEVRKTEVAYLDNKIKFRKKVLNELKAETLKQQQDAMAWQKFGLDWQKTGLSWQDYILQCKGGMSIYNNRKRKRQSSPNLAS